MLEIWRRVMLVAGVQAAVWLALLPAPALLRVGLEDMAARYRRQPAVLRGTETLEQYVSSQTKDRLLSLQGEPWQSFVADLARAGDGRANDPAWQARAGHDLGGSYFYFRPDEQPLAAVAAQVGPGRPFVYAALPADGGAVYIGINYQEPPDILRYAPSSMAYPRRAWAPWPLAAGLLLYALLPWPRHHPQALTYRRGRSVLLPDLLGTGLAAVFGALPLLIIPNVAGLDAVFDGGWWVLALVCWLLALLCLAVMAVSVQYTSLELLPLPHALRVTTWRGRREYAYADVAGLGPRTYQAPRALLGLGLVAVLINFRAAAPLLIQAGRRDEGMVLALRDGQKITLWDEFTRNQAPVVAEIRARMQEQAGPDSSTLRSEQ